MAIDDSERAHARRWVEHARDPDTESTPRAADATAGGEIELEQRLGYLCIKQIKDDRRTLANEITKQPGHLRELGRELKERIDFVELPSRIEIRQQHSDDLSAEEVGDVQLALGLDQLSKQALEAAIEAVIDIGDVADPNNDHEGHYRDQCQREQMSSDPSSEGEKNRGRRLNEL